jgi:type IV pilus assembly protein PilV
MSTMRKQQMQGNAHNASAAFQQGVVILESLIAILIFSMGILALVGLQAAMVKNASESKYRAEASFIAQQRLGTMWADTGNLADYLEADTDISGVLPGGTRTVVMPVAGEVSVTVTWQQPGEAQHNFTTNARIVGD